MSIRTAAPPAIPPYGADRYEGLLRAAEANPEEVFTMDGDKLASLIRDLQAPHRGRRRIRPHA